MELLTSRILFKTNSIQDVNLWQKDFSFLAPDLIHWLALKQVQLIGIDTPSMDHSESKSLEGHQTFFKNKIAILEGLDLRHIQSGVYLLVALPLKLKKAEASPIRAILIDQFNF